MRVLINGLGCTHTGAKIVLEQIIATTPKEHQVWAIVPIVDNSVIANVPSNVRLIRLKHSVWGMYLRIFVEMYVNIAMATRRFDLLINLSNYGFCFTKRQKLYIHNPFILDMRAPKKMGQGNPNKLVRMALNTFIRNGECIFVQTEHMHAKFLEYCQLNSLPVPANLKILRPPFPDTYPASHAPGRKSFPFEFFYPASHFPHKRVDLAIGGVLEARKINDRIGLNITVASDSEQPGIGFLGSITRQEVYQHFKNSDALLFTSERETLGLPLLEAMFFEKPAVLPDREYSREIYGSAGVYYEDDSTESISNAIAQLYDQYDAHVNAVRKRKTEQEKIRIAWADHWKHFMNKE